MKQWSDSLSAGWERYRTRLFEGQRPVSEWLVNQVDPQPGQVILELAAGPGETGFLAAQRVGPSGKVISTDLGPGMVDAARRGAKEWGLDNVECRVMDAQEIDLDDHSVDGVLCRFGLMLMPEPERALAGVLRALKPGGRLAFATWGGPDRNPWLTMLALAILENGHEPPGDPFAAGGPFSLADPEVARALVADAGFADPQVDELTNTMRFDGLDDYWDFQNAVAGPIALFMASIEEKERQAVRETLEPMLEPFKSDGGYSFPTQAVGVAASAS